MVRLVYYGSYGKGCAPFNIINHKFPNSLHYTQIPAVVRYGAAEALFKKTTSAGLNRSVAAQGKGTLQEMIHYLERSSSS